MPLLCCCRHVCFVAMWPVDVTFLSMPCNITPTPNTHCPLKSMIHMCTGIADVFCVNYIYGRILCGLLTIQHVTVLFTRESSYCFQRVLAVAILSVCPSVCPSVHLSVTRVDQSKVMQARITKSSLSAARKTLVTGTVKRLHKFEGGHPERGC